MCTPELVAKGSLAGSAASTAYGTVGAYYAASGERIGLKAQAALADTNARIAELDAKSELLAGQKDTAKVRLATTNLKGAQRAGMSANGIALDSETAVNVLTTTDTIGEIDANTTMANAARVAWGYRTQAVNYKNEALLKRSGAKGINPWMSAGTTLLTGAKTVASDYFDLKKQGAFK